MKSVVYSSGQYFVKIQNWKNQKQNCYSFRSDRGWDVVRNLNWKHIFIGCCLATFERREALLWAAFNPLRILAAKDHAAVAACMPGQFETA